MPAHVPPPPSIAIAIRQVASSDCSGEFDVVFDQLSETKARLVLRNLGPEACRLLVYPTISFKSHSGETLDIARFNPFHPGNLDLGHGPVMPLITIVAGGAASADISWTDKPSARDHCLRASALQVSLGRSKDYKRKVSVTMCGDRERSPIVFQQSALKSER